MSLPDRNRSSAILIGTGTFQDRRLPEISAIGNNLADLREALTDPYLGGFAPEHCTVIENPVDARRVASELATVAETTEDVLLVYYAGHGLLGSRQGELYLGLATTSLNRPEYSALPFAWIRNEILDSPAAIKVLILDCCFSGRAIGGGFLGNDESVFLGQVDVRGTYTLTSTSANAAALAPPGVRYTAFSGELLRLLREGLPSGPPTLDLRLIYYHLKRRMAAQGWPSPHQSGTDTVHALALGRNPSHARHGTSFSLPIGIAPRPTADQVVDRGPHPPTERLMSPALGTQPKATARKSSPMTTIISMPGFALVFGAPLWSLFLGDAIRHLFIIGGAHPFGADEYGALLLSAMILAVAVGLGYTTATEIEDRGMRKHPGDAVASLFFIPLLAVVDVVTLLVGIAFGGHLWGWVDGISTLIANWLVWRF